MSWRTVMVGVSPLASFGRKSGRKRVTGSSSEMTPFSTSAMAVAVTTGLVSEAQRKMVSALTGVFA